MIKMKLKIGELFKYLNLDNTVYKEEVFKNEDEIYVKTPNGNLTKINYFVKKPKQESITILFKNGIKIKCSPNHIFIDENNNNVFSKDAKIIKTINGNIEVDKIIKDEDCELYDINIDSPHLYVSSNGVIHHNTKLVSLMLKYAYNNTEYLPYDKMDIDIIENQFISVGRVKSTNVLASDQFWESIQKAQHDFIILDDLDFMLTKRESEVQTQDDVIRNQFLSQFLPFTDGIENNNTKFIITTNQTYEHMDSALLRKGRLFDILELRNLKVQEAKEIWLENSLKEEDFNTLFNSNTVVNPADLGSEIHKRTNKRIKNKTKNYLLESEISKVQKARKNKKIVL